MTRWYREVASHYIKAALAAQHEYAVWKQAGKHRLQKLTLLHSNDMHGDFMADEIDSELVGGVAMLSGYLNKARGEEDAVLYAVAGDMFLGSLIDSEYKGISTIQIMNMLAPDIATIGNHEVDYGTGHMLFLEKCANFPIVNANLRISTNHERLFDPFRIIEVSGMRILFIGVVTEAILDKCRDVGFVGSFVEASDALREIERICNAYGGPGIDLTVLLTHIGFEEDKKLAERIDPSWGVDLIIGGHSHTLLKEPCVVNGIPIVQVGTGTDQIGRFDITIDTVEKAIESYSWQVVPIDSSHCPTDEALEKLIIECKKTTDEKYAQVLCRLERKLTHPVRERETELGDLFCDILRDATGADVFLVASGSIRGEEMGPIVTKGDLTSCLPYDDEAHIVYMTGAQLKHSMLHMLRDETLCGAHGEFFQVSSGLKIEYDQASHDFESFAFNGRDVDDGRFYAVGLQHYFLENAKRCYDLSVEDLKENRPIRTVVTSCTDIIEEYLLSGEYTDVSDESRITLHLA